MAVNTAYEPISELDWSESTYIGDGVYVLRDDARAMFWLRTDRDFTPHVMAFDADTLASLVKWLNRQYPTNMQALSIVPSTT